MEASETTGSLLSPLYIFFFIGAVVSSYLFGRFQNVSQAFLPETKVQGVSTANEKFQVSNIRLRAEPTEKSGCLYGTFHLTGLITASGKGAATYKWEGSGNSTLSPIILEFSESGTKIVETDWRIFGEGAQTVRLHILSPNDTSSPETTLKLVCS